MYKEKGLELNTKIDIGGEGHNYEIGNLRTKNKTSSFLEREGGREREEKF